MALQPAGKSKGHPLEKVKNWLVCNALPEQATIQICSNHPQSNSKGQHLAEPQGTEHSPNSN